MTEAQLLTSAGVVKNETQEAANTAFRIGSLFENFISSIYAFALPITGGTMTGQLVLHADATTGLQAVTYQQFNTAIGAYIPLAGSNAITGNLKYQLGTTAEFGTYDNNGLSIVTNNTEKLYITAGGLVGIGQGNPSSRIHLKGTTNDATAYALKVDNSGDANILSIRNDGLILMGSQTFSNTGITKVLDLGSESGTVRGAFTNNTKLRLNGDGSSNNIGFGMWSDGTNGGVELQLSNTYIDYRIYQGAGLESWALLSENAGGAWATRLTRRLGAGYGLGHYNSMFNSLNAVVDYSFIGTTAMVDTAGSHVGDFLIQVANSGSLVERLRVKGGGFIGFNTSSPTAVIHGKGTTSDNSAYALKIDNSSNVQLIHAQNNGNVYIGDNTAYGGTSFYYQKNNGYDGAFYINGNQGNGINLGKYMYINMQEVRIGNQNTGSFGQNADYGILLQVGNRNGVIAINPTIHTSSYNTTFKATFVEGSGANNFNTVSEIVYNRTLAFNDAGSQYLYGQRIDTSLGSFTNSGAGNAINVGLYVGVGGGDVNYAALFSGGSVGIGTTTPNTSALLDMTSTTKGFLPPRMTGAQAEAISSPAEGLLVYSTDDSGVTINAKGWWGYEGSTWNKLN